MKLTNQLKEQVDFSYNEKIIADYILKNKEQVVSMSIQDLAKKTYTSTSSVMRLCSRLNLSGFKEFKVNLLQEGSQVEDDQALIDPNFPFNIESTTLQIATNLKKLTTQSLNEAQKLLSIPDMNKAANLLAKAKNVALFGIGDAYLAGLSFQTRMMQVGVNIIATPVYGEQFHQANLLDKDDAALIVSYSGETEPTVACAKLLKRKHVSTVCICSNINSPLAKYCDIVLVLPANEVRLEKIGTFFSQACMDYYLNILYSKLYIINHSKN